MTRPGVLLSVVASLILALPAALHAAPPAKAASAKAAPAAPAKSGYHVAKEIPIGGEGGWDYLTVDSAARRLYLSHATKVVVVDVDNDKKVGEIGNLSGVHGIALALDYDRGYISNGRSSMITIFDLKTLATIGEVKSTGENPDAIIYDAYSYQIFAFNGRSKNATVLEAKTGKVVGTIQLGGGPKSPPRIWTEGFSSTSRINPRSWSSARRIWR